LTIEEYHKLSDEYIDAVVSRMEQLQEERDDVDVEYSVSISLLQPYLPVPIIRHNILISITGRCSQPHISSGRHICNQQATAKQADLALIPHLRPKTIWLRVLERGTGLERGYRGGWLGLLKGYEYAQLDIAQRGGHWLDGAAADAITVGWGVKMEGRGDGTWTEKAEGTGGCYMALKKLVMFDYDDGRMAFSSGATSQSFV
jgi:hypothetical protein